jgi:4-hydroxy-4-methyl-2-oxoglutarate aldolase
VTEYGSATIFEAAAGRAHWLRGLRPAWTGAELAGPAVTVSAPPGDNLALHRAVPECPPGSVLAAATGGTTDTAVWGEVLTVAALARGVAGLVTDGAVRDVARIRELGFPVFCAGTTPVGPGKAAQGELGSRIRLGGTDVAPGDWLVADDDGAVTVEADAVETTLAAAAERTRREAQLLERIRAGDLTLDLLGLR